MVREGRVFRANDSNGKPEFGSGYSVTAYEPGAVVSAASSGTAIAVYTGHAFEAGDKVMVSTYNANTDPRYDVVGSVSELVVNIYGNMALAEGEILVNLGPDTGSTAPNWDGSEALAYTDSGYTTLAVDSTVYCDDNGRYRYYHTGIKRWELVRSGSTVIAVYTDTAPLQVSGGPVNVLDFGAAGDGIVDDTASLQAAIAHAIATGTRHVYIPVGDYLITSSLNLTDVFGFRLEGAVGYSDSRNASRLIAQTGTEPAIDLVGNNNTTIEHIFIDGRDAGTPSQIGLLLGRSTTYDSEHIVLDDVNINLPSSNSANGGLGTIGVYIFGSELGAMRDCTIIADNGVVFTRGNLYSAITSTNVPLKTTAVSMSHWDLGGAMEVWGGKGPALTFADVYNIYFNGFMYRSVSSGVTPYDYAVKFTPGALLFSKMVTIEGNVEGFNQAVYVDVGLDNCAFRLLVSPNSLAQFVFSSYAGSIRQCEFRLNPGDATTHVLIDMSAGAWSFRGNTAYLFDNQSISAASSTAVFGNNVIDASTTDPSSRITYGAGAVEAFVSGNVQGARTLTTATRLVQVLSTGTLQMVPNVTASLSTGAITLGAGATGGWARNIGTWSNVAATSGSDSACSNGTAYCGSIFVPLNCTITGIQYLVGSVGGTNKVVVSLHSSTGALLANSAVAGTTVGTAAQVQQVAFTAPYAAVGPQSFFVAVTFDGTTAKFRTVPAFCNGNGVVGDGVTQTFGTPATFTAPTSFVADKVPVASVY